MIVVDDQIAAKSVMGEAATSTLPRVLPITLLSGFLGSGKTTLLQHILKSDHGYKIAVIVNDIGAINVDASLIKHTVSRTKETVIALENGCICCTLRGDLLQELVRLAELAEFDYVIIESSGISEPGQVAETFDSRLAEQMLNQGAVLDGLDESALGMLKRLKTAGGVEKFARLDTTCTVIDAFTIMQDFETADLLSARRNDVVPEDERTISDLMVDQIEFADMVVINKVDMVKESVRGSIRSLVSKLNHRAKVFESSYGRVDVRQIIDTGLSNLERAQTGYGWLQDLHAMTLRKLNGKAMITPRPETEEYNVQNFVYVRRRPFHPRRLFDLIYDKFILQHEIEEASGEEETGMTDGEDEDQHMDDDNVSEDGELMEDAPELPDNNTILMNKKRNPLFAKLFRSKGEIWLATRPNRAGEWSQAGAMLTIVGGRPWFAVTPEGEWRVGNREIDAMVQVDIEEGGVYGDRRQELVFIGEQLDVVGLEEVLDQCLLTDTEWVDWQAVMGDGEGPNGRGQEGITWKEEQLNNLYEDGFPDWPEEDDPDPDHDHAHPHAGGHSHKHKRNDLVSSQGSCT